MPVALAAMLASQILVSLASLVLPVLAPLVALALGVPAYLVGFYVAILYGVAALSSLTSGGFVTRYGALRVNQACLVLVALALWLAAVGQVATIGLAAAVIGLAYGPVTPASSHILAKVTAPGQMNLVFSLKQTGVPLGNALAGALIPGLAVAFDWRVSAITVGIVCAALAVILQPLRGAFDGDRRPGQPVLCAARFVEPFRLVVGSKPIRLLALTSIGYSGMQVCLGAFLTSYLNRDADLSLVAAGFALSAAQFAGVGGRILWGVIADRVAPPRLVLGGLGIAMTIAALLVGGFGPSWPYAAIILVCIGFGGSAIAWNGVFFAQIARHAPPGRVGEVTGGSTFFTYGGILLAPSLFSAILGVTGSYALGFAMLALTTLLAGLSFFRSRS